MNTTTAHVLSDTSILERAALRVYGQLKKVQPRPTWLERSEGSLWHIVACILEAQSRLNMLRGPLSTCPRQDYLIGVATAVLARIIRT